VSVCTTLTVEAAAPAVTVSNVRIIKTSGLPKGSSVPSPSPITKAATGDVVDIIADLTNSGAAGYWYYTTTMTDPSGVTWQTGTTDSIYFNAGESKKNVVMATWVIPQQTGSYRFCVVPK
jgi:hypothetical protein